MDIIKNILLYWFRCSLKTIFFVSLVIVILFIALNTGNLNGRYVDYTDDGQEWYNIDMGNL